MAFLASAEHSGHEGMDAIDDAPEVHSQHPLPGFYRLFPERLAARAADSGVVAEHVHCAELVEGGAG